MNQSISYYTLMIFVMLFWISKTFQCIAHKENMFYEVEEVIVAALLSLMVILSILL